MYSLFTCFDISNSPHQYPSILGNQVLSQFKIWVENFPVFGQQITITGVFEIRRDNQINSIHLSIGLVWQICGIFFERPVMVINIRSYDPIRYGRMEVEKISNNLSDVYFLPPDHSIKKAGFDPSKTHIHRAKLLEINCQDRSLAIFPIKTYGYRDDFLQPKYRKIKRIILEDEWIIYPDMIDSAPTTADDILEILENLPQAFTKDYAFGLGLAKPYRFIIDAVEKLTNCTEIAITDKNETGLAQNEKCFYISKKDFHDARRSMNNIGNLAQVAVRTVRGTTAYN
ncbi:MAG: hypothetical protein F4093_02135, partial [Gammaproteobacteria bacterium]|nr:hypothetical protein [Gammaproteobacteria bacterium]